MQARATRCRRNRFTQRWPSKVVMENGWRMIFLASYSPKRARGTRYKECNYPLSEFRYFVKKMSRAVGLRLVPVRRWVLFRFGRSSYFVLKVCIV